ncbi:MAG: TPR repeat protein [Pseudohongiellaceae bacterium]
MVDRWENGMFRLIFVLIALSFANSIGASEESEFFAEMQVLADQGHAIAQFFLGDAYSNGEGVLQDKKEAVKWYSLAAEQGDADAQFNLGAAYYNGEGVFQDLVIAYKWINLAAYSGKQGAVETRETLAQLMTPAQIGQAQRMAEQWREASVAAPR